MVATPVALLAHVKATPLIVLLLLSFAVAANCCVPVVRIEGEVGVTTMVATTGLLGGGIEVEEPPPQPT
jgi:hypothetical protein